MGNNMVIIVKVNLLLIKCKNLKYLKFLDKVYVLGILVVICIINIPTVIINSLRMQVYKC